MRIVIDTNILIQMIGMRSDRPLFDPATGEEVTRPAARALALMDAIDARKGTIVIPTPVLTEFLLGIPEDTQRHYIDELNGSRLFEIVPFGQRAAIECARLLNPAELKQLNELTTKAKLRFDRQIIAIALASGASELWTHDGELMDKAKECGIAEVASLVDITPKPEQGRLEIAPNDEIA